MDEVVKVNGGLADCNFRCYGVEQNSDVVEIVEAGRRSLFVPAEELDGEVKTGHAHAALPCERRGALKILGSLTFTIFVLEERCFGLPFSGGPMFVASGRCILCIISSCETPRDYRTRRPFFAPSQRFLSRRARAAWRAEIESWPRPLWLLSSL